MGTIEQLVERLEGCVRHDPDGCAYLTEEANDILAAAIPLDRDAQLLAPMAWDALTETAREFWRDEARRRRSMIGE